jgi:hypothetical protein
VEPVLRLVEDDRLRAVHHRVRDFLVPVRGQAVHEKRVGLGAGHELRVHLERLEEAAPLLLLLRRDVIAHPGVGVDDVRAGDRGRRVVDDLHLGAVGERASLLHHGRLRRRLGPLRAAHADAHPRDGAAVEERVRHVVEGVADVGQRQTLELPLALPHRHEVGQDLAGMRVVRQRVDDRHGRVARQRLDRLVLVQTRDDAIRHPGDDAGEVLDGLLLAERRALDRVVDRVPAELGHAHLEGDPRPKGRLLEQHQERLPAQGLPELPRLRLDHVRLVQQGEDLVSRPVLERREMLPRHGLLRTRSRREIATA